MAWHRLASSQGLGVGSVATARGAKRERARSRARHGLSEEVDQRVNEVRGARARTRTLIHTREDSLKEFQIQNLCNLLQQGMLIYII